MAQKDPRRTTLTTAIVVKGVSKIDNIHITGFNAVEMGFSLFILFVVMFIVPAFIDFYAAAKLPKMMSATTAFMFSALPIIPWVYLVLSMLIAGWEESRGKGHWFEAIGSVLVLGLMVLTRPTGDFNVIKGQLDNFQWTPAWIANHLNLYSATGIAAGFWLFYNLTGEAKGWWKRITGLVQAILAWPRKTVASVKGFFQKKFAKIGETLKRKPGAPKAPRPQRQTGTGIKLPFTLPFGKKQTPKPSGNGSNKPDSSGDKPQRQPQQPQGSQGGEKPNPKPANPGSQPAAQPAQQSSQGKQ